MYKVILNGTEIQQPEELVNLIFKKEYSEIFNGFIVGNSGYLEQLGGLTFLQKEAVDIINTNLKKDGILATIPIEIYYCDRLIYSGNLDNSTYSNFECCKVNMALSTDKLGDILNSKRNVIYSLKPTRKILLPKKDFSTSGLYEISEFSHFKTSASGVHLNLGVPLKSDGKSVGMVDSSIADGTMYEAKSDLKLKISGIIAWEENSTKDYDLIMIVKDSGGSIISTTVIQSFIHTGSLIQRQSIISKEIDLLQGYKVSFWLHDSTINTPFEFHFSDATFLQIIDTPEENIESSYCYGLTAYEAFVQVMDKISPQLKFRSEFFSLFGGINDFITSGNNIRGEYSEIKVSLQYLFENFSKLYDLESNLTGDKYNVEKCVDNPLNCEYLNAVISNYNENADIDRLYSSVKVGFTNWATDSKIKGYEHNSIRTYQSQLNFGSRELDLVSDFITSGYVIEEMRRMQFDAEKKVKEHKFDDSIFLIALNDTMEMPEQINDYNPVSNILISDGVYNLKYAPTNSLRNNSRKLKYLGELSFTSGVGNYNLTVNGDSDDGKFNFGANIPLICDFEAEIDFEDFENRKDATFEVCGVEKSIKITDLQVSPKANGKGIAKFTGYLI